MPPDQRRWKIWQPSRIAGLVPPQVVQGPPLKPGESVPVVEAVLTDDVRNTVEMAMYDVHCTLTEGQYAALAEAALRAAGFVSEQNEGGEG